ncbi:MAG: DUF423 domain-containing protein [Chloroflexi bacterium]|nr:DUF423 domain-containing protein [Chloroflexota bacterium]
MSKTFVLLAAIFGFLGVGLGAFGTHTLGAIWDARPDDRAIYETGSQYHLIHAAVLLGAAYVVSAVAPSGRRWARAAGWLFAAGIILFSGSLYLLSVLDLRFMGAIAPIGGVLLLAGWASLGLASRHLD